MHCRLDLSLPDFPKTKIIMAKFRVLRATILLVIVSTLCVFLPESAMCDPETTAKPRLDVIAEVRKVVGKMLDDPSGSFTRKVLQADLSTSCSFGLIKLLRAVKRVDSWAFRRERIQRY